MSYLIGPMMIGIETLQGQIQEEIDRVYRRNSERIKNAENGYDNYKLKNFEKTRKK